MTGPSGTSGTAHQHLLLRLARWIADYLDRYPIGTVFIAPVDYFPDDNSYVQPDLFVLPGKFEDLPDNWRDIPRPLLVVEALSPASLRADRGVKRRRYQDARVDEYWIVDPQWRTVERWRPTDRDGETVDGILEWQPAGVAEPLRISLPDYFATLGPHTR